jgi:hypothetical protein
MRAMAFLQFGKQGNPFLINELRKATKNARLLARKLL